MDMPNRAAAVLIEKGKYFAVLRENFAGTVGSSDLLFAVASDINDRFGNVNGVTLHYLAAGKGSR